MEPLRTPRYAYNYDLQSRGGALRISAGPANIATANQDDFTHSLRANFRTLLGLDGFLPHHFQAITRLLICDSTLHNTNYRQ